jgi:acyl-CoA synthetase (NDP forming)
MSSDLSAFFDPRSLVLVGASERSAWSNTARDNLIDLKYSGKVHFVNRKGSPVYGSTAAARVSDIGEQIDLALLMLPANAVEEGFAHLHSAGVRNAVLLASGFAETGVTGRQAQDRMLGLAREYGISLLGPNCLGFVNYSTGAAAYTIRPPMPVLRGTVGVLSQSGAVGNYANRFAHRQNIGLSCVITSGNEADLDSGQLIEYLINDPSTKAIAVFLETVRDTERFSAAAAMALRAGKPIVALKIGASPATAKSAQAHTGALVGDDRVFSAVCKQLGIVRVHSIEDMMNTAEILSRVGVIKKGGLGLASISGGVCEIMGDVAGARGIAMPELLQQTEQRLKQVMPDFGTPHNPLDVTGAAILQPSLMGETVRILSEDTGMGVLAVAFDVPTTAQLDHAYSRPALASIQQAALSSPIPCLIVSHTWHSLTEYASKIVDELGLNYLPCGVDVAIPALGRALEWSRLYLAARDQAMPQPLRHSTTPERPSSEHALLKYLGARGVPVVPQSLAANETEAVHAAAAMGGQVVLKVASRDIPHKTEVGGVILNLQGDRAVTSAFRDIMIKARIAMPDAHLDGVVVSPMRRGGIELLVGIHVDEQWGPVLAVGLGGVWVEVLKDTSLRTLPVTEVDVLEMLSELRASRLLDGFRGQVAVDRQVLARAIVAIASAALDLGPSLETLEINPLLANGNQVEALDALAVWQNDKAAQ